MSKKPQYDPEEIRFPDQHIVERSLVPEMEKSYIEYAMSVIVGRALPDVRDGLKPVHRRILYAMYEDNLTSDRPFKKSATCVGDVLGRYHPHGDASVYEALVRLAQDFSMRYMLVEGRGNFGSVDGDPAAAYRYTEARLSKISNEMLRDIRKDTVDWDPNFDESRKEPRVLPSRFPNLLVNGSSGIAVRMVPAEHVADAGGRLLERLVRGKPVLVHRVQYAPVHGLQPVPDIRQRPRDDDAHGVVDKARLHLADDLARDYLLLGKHYIFWLIIFCHLFTTLLFLCGFWAATPGWCNPEGCRTPPGRLSLVLAKESPPDPERKAALGAVVCRG